MLPRGAGRRLEHHREAMSMLASVQVSIPLLLLKHEARWDRLRDASRYAAVVAQTQRGD